jgi:DNA-binding NarL/FixJ family response regulator
LATLSFDPVLSQIAQAKLSGYSNSEIAQRLSLSLRTVERNLAFIRKLWTPEALK